MLLAAGLPRAGRAQVLVGATPFGPVFGGLRPAGADTALLLLARARRVGVSTFVQTSGARGYLRLGPRQQLRYRVGTDWVYDSRGLPPFVREDYGADLAHVFSLGPPSTGSWASSCTTTRAGPTTPAPACGWAAWATSAACAPPTPPTR